MLQPFNSVKILWSDHDARTVGIRKDKCQGDGAARSDPDHCLRRQLMTAPSRSPSPTAQHFLLPHEDGAASSLLWADCVPEPGQTQPGKQALTSGSATECVGPRIKCKHGASRSKSVKNFKTALNRAGVLLSLGP